MAYVFRTRDKSGKIHPRWRFQYTDWQGKRHTKTGTRSKKETETLAKRTESYHEEIRCGFRPPPREASVAERRPFAEVVNEYLDWGRAQGGRRGRPWSTGHARMQRSRLTWWKKKLGLKTLKELTGCLARVEKVLRSLQNTGASGKTLNDYAASLHSFCNWCIDRDYMEEHPLKKLKRFDATPKTVRRAITPEEIACLLEVAPEHRRILYETAFCSGLRAKELKSLTVHDLDLRRGGLHLHAKWTKNRMAGFQPLPSAVLGHLTDFVESGQAAALYRRNYIRHDTKYEYPEEPLLYVPSNTSRMTDQDLKAAGIPKWTEEGKVDFHAFRVSYVSLVVETGADLKAAQSLARHTTPELTMNVYARVRGSKLTEVAEAVGRIILPLANIKLAQRNREGFASLELPSGYTKSRGASIPAASTILRLERTGKRRLSRRSPEDEAGHVPERSPVAFDRPDSRLPTLSIAEQTPVSGPVAGFRVAARRKCLERNSFRPAGVSRI